MFKLYKINYTRIILYLIILTFLFFLQWSWGSEIQPLYFKTYQTLPQGLKIKKTNNKKIILTAYQEVSFSLPLIFKPEKINLSNFPCFQISLHQRDSQNPLGFNIEFDLDTDQNNQTDTIILVPIKFPVPKPIETIDFKKVKFKPKTIIYLLKRELGLSFDKNWRYIQDGPFVVIQRRFSKNIKKFPIIKLICDKNMQGKIEFKVDFNHNNKPDAIITYNQTIHDIEYGTHFKVIQVDLLNTVKKLYPDKKEVWLAEVVIFVKGNKEKVLEKMPLRYLQFYKTSELKLKSVNKLKKKFVEYKIIWGIPEIEDNQIKINLTQLINVKKELIEVWVKNIILHLDLFPGSTVILKNPQFYRSIKEEKIPYKPFLKLPSRFKKEPKKKKIKSIFLNKNLKIFLVIFIVGNIYLILQIWQYIPLGLKFVGFALLTLIFYVWGFRYWIRDNFYITLGEICFVFTYHYLTLILRPILEKKVPKITEFIYQGSGSIYIVGFIITLVLAALCLIFRLEGIANEIATVGYFLLVVGVVKELIDFIKEKRKENLNKQT